MQFFRTVTLGKPLNMYTKFQFDIWSRFAMKNTDFKIENSC